MRLAQRTNGGGNILYDPVRRQLRPCVVPHVQHIALRVDVARHQLGAADIDGKYRLVAHHAFPPVFTSS